MRDGLDPCPRRRVAKGDRRDSEIACHVVNVFATGNLLSSSRQGGHYPAACGKALHFSEKLVGCALVRVVS